MSEIPQIYGTFNIYDFILFIEVVALLQILTVLAILVCDNRDILCESTYTVEPTTGCIAREAFTSVIIPIGPIDSEDSDSQN